MRNACCAALGLLLLSGSLVFAQNGPEVPAVRQPPTAEAPATSIPMPDLPSGQNPGKEGPQNPAAAPVVTFAPSTGTGGGNVAECFACQADTVSCARRSAWVSADYLLWWMRSGPTSGPLVTTGSVRDFIPGALGQPNTGVLFGDRNLNYGAFSGLRLSGGLDVTSSLAVEGSYFFLERRSVHFNAAADPAGNPVIGRPIFNNQTGLQDLESTSFPGRWTGNTDIASHTSLQGYEINLAGHLSRTESGSLDWLAGFRSLNLNEDLVAQDLLVPLVPNALSFRGAAANPPSTLTDFDRFHTRNNFYGGQVGARWEGGLGQFRLGVTGKIALGANQQLVTIDGASALNTPGAASVTAPGGILAQTSNNGRSYRSVFAAVPEANVNLGWQINSHLQATVGYTFLYCSNVVRPGNQIDRTVNPALPPTDQLFGNGLGQNRPAFNFHSSDFWAQGMNFGLVYRY